jgi:Uncharacterized protein family UPF0016
MMIWTVAAPAISAAFLSSLVEAVEALTIVLAVGTVRGWRPAGLGALVGLVLLALIVLALGPLLDRVPLHLLQLAIGVLLLLFGIVAARALNRGTWRSRTRYPTDQRNRVRPRRRAARAPAGRAAGHERDCGGNCHDRKRAGPISKSSNWCQTAARSAKLMPRSGI